MSSARKLIIHIGSHKTGTSSIQYALYRNKAMLRRHGYTLFCRDLDGSERKSGNALPWVKFSLKREHRVEGRIRRKLADTLGGINGSVIISAETFSWVFDPEQIRKFQQRLAPHFDDIRVVAYIRRQDRQAVAQYRQASKYGAHIAARYYQGGSRALPPYREHFQSYLNYHQKLGMWADAFGWNKLRVRILDRDQTLNSDAVDDFFKIAGLDRNTQPIQHSKPIGLEKTKLGHLISEQEFPLAVRNALVKHLNNGTTPLPARGDALSFCKHFATSNELLKGQLFPDSRSGLFSDDFSMYPQEATDLWTEDSANSAIRHLLRGVSEISAFDTKDLALLRDCAESLESSHPARSRKLRDLARKLGGV